MNHAALEAVRTRLLCPWDGAAKPIMPLAAGLAALLLLAAFARVPGLAIFGHDEVHYYADFSVRLAEDGRWLNYWLHDFLRSLPLGLWGTLFLALAWTLFYRLARGFAFDRAYAAFVASIVVLAYPFAEQVLWPATATPALLIMLLASVLAARAVAYPLIYLLSGVLIFGSLQVYYFLLPLLFIPQFLPGSQQAPRPWRLLFSHLCWWVAGSVAGVLSMSLILWALTGHFGPQPAAWRLTMPVQDLPSLLRNLAYVSNAFVSHLELLLRLGGLTWSLLGLLALVTLLRARALLATPQALLLVAAVAVSYFVFSLPLAPLIHQRSLAALAAALILFLAFMPGASVAGRLFSLLLLLQLGHGFSFADREHLRQHESRTDFFAAKLAQLMPAQASHYSAIALLGHLDGDLPEAPTFNDPALMHPIVLSLGARKYLDCRVDERCAPLREGAEVATLPFGRGQLVFAEGEGPEGRVGFLRYRAAAQRHGPPR